MCSECFDDLGPACGACGGLLVLLGRLGNLIHARCQACGLDQAQPAEPQEADPWVDLGGEG